MLLWTSVSLLGAEDKFGRFWRGALKGRPAVLIFSVDAGWVAGPVFKGTMKSTRVGEA